MKEFTFRPRCICYEINDNIGYKRKNIDFNAYGFNKREELYKNPLDYDIKKDINCVKRKIKR